MAIIPSSAQFLLVWKTTLSPQYGALYAATCSALVCCWGCSAIGFCLPSPLADFSLLLVATSARFPPEVCAAVTSRGKENFHGRSTQCPCSSSSLWPPALSHLPHPLLSLESQRLSQASSWPSSREAA